MNRRDQLLAQFLAALDATPAIWTLFERFALQAVSRGRGRYGARAIVELVRWHVDVELGGDFKLRNDYTPFLARLFALAHPAHAELFAFREQRSKNRRAKIGPELTLKDVATISQPELFEGDEALLRARMLSWLEQKRRNTA